MHPVRALPLLLLFATVALPARAQETVIQRENVRMEYARVLRAEPVYQTLRATSMVERCEQSTPVVQPEEPKSGFARLLGSVKSVLMLGSDSDEPEQAKPVQGAEKPREGCRMVPVNREFQRPIAYDVDYVHHGVKYRSRLPYDPGDRLRVRVSVMPILPSDDDR